MRIKAIQTELQDIADSLVKYGTSKEQNISELIEHIKVCVAYMKFDIESLRREKAELIRRFDE